MDYKDYKELWFSLLSIVRKTRRTNWSKNQILDIMRNMMEKKLLGEGLEEEEGGELKDETD